MTIKDLLMSERSPIEPMLQHMYLAVAQTHLGSATGATNEWQRALEVAKTPEKLLALAKYAEQNSANDIADAAYSEAIKIAPKNREAYTGRLRLALAAGRTAQAQTIAAEIAQLWPDDAAARNQDAYLRLLLGASDGAAEAAERDAEVLVRKEPRNWLARATLGLARLRLGRKQGSAGGNPRSTRNRRRTAGRDGSARRNSGRERLRRRRPERRAPSRQPNRFCPKNALSSLRCCNSTTSYFALIVILSEAKNLRSSLPSSTGDHKTSAAVPIRH